MAPPHPPPDKRPSGKTTTLVTSNPATCNRSRCCRVHCQLLAYHGQNSPLLNCCTRYTRQSSLVFGLCVPAACHVTALQMMHKYNLDAPEPSNPFGYVTPHHSTTFHNCRFGFVAISSHAQVFGVRCCQHVVLSVIHNVQWTLLRELLGLPLYPVYSFGYRVCLGFSIFRPFPFLCQSSQTIPEHFVTGTSSPFYKPSTQEQTARPTATWPLDSRMTNACTLRLVCQKVRRYKSTDGRWSSRREKGTKLFGKVGQKSKNF